jgi:hypothetical protein
MHSVEVVNSSPSIGGECRKSLFSRRSDAWDFFTRWQGLINAKRDVDLCDKDLDIFVATGDEGYRVIFKKTSAPLTL